MLELNERKISNFFEYAVSLEKVDPKTPAQENREKKFP
jgi:hypothetical protein